MEYLKMTTDMLRQTKLGNSSVKFVGKWGYFSQLPSLTSFHWHFFYLPILVQTHVPVVYQTIFPSFDKKTNWTTANQCQSCVLFPIFKFPSSSICLEKNPHSTFPSQIGTRFMAILFPNLAISRDLQADQSNVREASSSGCAPAGERAPGAEKRGMVSNGRKMLSRNGW